MGAESTPAFVEVVFRPNLAVVSIVRRFILQFYERANLSGETSAMLALATHELLDNAVLYSVDGETKLRVQVLGAGSEDGEVTIDTWNRTDPENHSVVENAITELNDAEDAQQMYQNLLLRASRRTGGSGLGLVRIKAEVGMEVTSEHDGEFLHIHAQAKLPLGGEME